MKIAILIILVGGFNFLGWGWEWGGGGVEDGVGVGVVEGMVIRQTPLPPSQPKLYLQKINIAQTCTYKNVWNAMQSMAGDVSRNKSNGNSFNKKAIINHSKMIALFARV